MPRTLATAALRLLALSAALLAAPGCVKHTNGGTTLYVYDNASSSVKVWDDVNKVYDAALGATAVPAADRTITSSVIGSVDLAWGGLAHDNNSNRIYLVTNAGTVFVITKADSQNGSISKTTDITSFYLGSASSDRFSQGSVFGQASVDGGQNILYVLENANDGSATRIWKITGASQVSNGFTFTPATSYTLAVLPSDTFGAGVAAIPGGNLYGLAGGGPTLYNGLGTLSYSGARIRQSQSGAFSSSTYVNSGVQIGPSTGLGSPLAYGGLAYDSQNSALYVFAPTSSAPASASVLVFNSSKFTAGLDQAPSRTLGDAAGALASLRTISHPAVGDWLLGVNFTAAGTSVIGEGTGTDVLRIWKNPSGGGAAVSATLPGTTEIRGMAIGGTN